jgi:hypothetical protein
MRADSSVVRIDPKIPPPGGPTRSSAALRSGAASRLRASPPRRGLPARLLRRRWRPSTPSLALQGEGDPAERRRRTLKRGHDLLDGLDRLKAALLFSSRVPTTDLLRLAGQLAEHADLSGDPRLDELISHIELRAKVELAKLGVS